MWASVLLLFTLLASLYFELLKPNPFIYLSLIILAICPIATNIYGNYEYFPKDFVSASTISLNEDNVIIDNQEFKLNEIKRIELEVNDWFGKKIVRNVRPYGSGPKLSMGINNSIIIDPVDSKQIKLLFQLESNNQFIELGNWLKSIYKSQIIILEKYDHLRSYGLKHLDFKDIQKFKEEYKT